MVPPVPYLRVIKTCTVLNFFLVPPMLDECIKYLEARMEGGDFSYEIIVVDDGSKDKTVEVVNNYCKKFGAHKIRCLSLAKNRGKGGAVRLVSI